MNKRLNREQNRIQMVVTDLDDTLLATDKTISEKAVAEINRLEEKGILFTFITGRPSYALEKFASQVNITAPIVSCNGSYIYDYIAREVLESLPLEIGGLINLIHRAYEEKLTVLVLVGEIEYALGRTAWVRVREEQGRVIPIISIEELWNVETPIYKMNIMADENQEGFVSLSETIDEVAEQYSIALYGNSGCEIVARGVNKETGLRKLCQILRIPMENVLALGDNINDLEMLKAAGIGVAVNNATLDTKKCADYITKEERTDGVIEALEIFIE